MLALCICGWAQGVLYCDTWRALLRHKECTTVTQGLYLPLVGLQFCIRITSLWNISVQPELLMSFGIYRESWLDYQSRFNIMAELKMAGCGEQHGCVVHFDV